MYLALYLPPSDFVLFDWPILFLFLSFFTFGLNIYYFMFPLYWLVSCTFNTFKGYSSAVLLQVSVRKYTVCTRVWDNTLLSKNLAMKKKRQLNGTVVSSWFYLLVQTSRDSWQQAGSFQAAGLWRWQCPGGHTCTLHSLQSSTRFQPLNSGSLHTASASAGIGGDGATECSVVWLARPELSVCSVIPFLGLEVRLLSGLFFFF